MPRTRSIRSSTVITKSLKKKEKVLLVGFGTFQVSRRKATEGRNPQTGEKIKIPAATCRASKPARPSRTPSTDTTSFEVRFALPRVRFFRSCDTNGTGRLAQR